MSVNWVGAFVEAGEVVFVEAMDYMRSRDVFEE